jgi:hypothetical protein
MQAVALGCLAALALAGQGCGGPEGAAPAGEAAAATASYDWLQYNGDAAHGGNNTAETTITAQNVGTLQRLFQVTLPAVADGAPVVLTGVSTAGGVRDLVFVTTKAGHIVALDARTGATVWSAQNGTGTCRINRGSAACYTTSSPAIDPNRQFVYSYGLEGRVHKYAVGTGAEVTTGGWPEVATLKPWDEKGSPALVFATDASGTTWLYMANGGYPGDAGDYQGHITAINLADGSQHVFNTLCSDQAVHFVASPGAPDCSGVQSAVWARAPVVYDARIDRIFIATGNGAYAPLSHFWGDTVMALSPGGAGAGGDPLDAWTPTNFQSLQAADADVGSTAPAILPNSGTRYPHLAVQGGKDAMLRLLDLDDLSGQGGPGHTGGQLFTVAVPQGGIVLTAPAVWVNPADGSTWVFVSNGNGISGMTLTLDASGNPSLTTRWRNGAGGFSPLVANGVLYYAGSANLHALNPTTGATLLAYAGIGSIHWESPVVANGVVYVTDEAAHLTALALPTMTPDFALSASPASVSVAQGASGTSTVTVTPGGGFAGTVALSASGLPAGVTASFSPASTTGTSTLTLAASSTATTGAATVTITGTSGTLTHTATVTLTVTSTATPPAAPTSFTGTATAGTTSDTVRLTWVPADAKATSFRVQAAINATFTSGVQTSTFPATTTSVTQAGVPRGLSYYVRIQAVNAAGASAWTNLTPSPLVTP